MMEDGLVSKVGILTFWNVPNYGTFFQAYAMQKVLAQLLPDDEVVLIRWLHPGHYAAYYAYDNCPYHYKLINPRFYRNIIKRFLHRSQINGLKAFGVYYDVIPHTQEQGDAVEQCAFDYVVLGSDIIWDYSQPIFFHDPHLFGQGLQAKHIVAYAPSFGTVKVGQSAPQYVVDALGKMEAISVRDQNSADVVKDLSGREAEVVLDPTLLLDFWQDRNIKKPEIEGKYIAVYGSTFSPELVRGGRAYAAEHGLKLVCLDSLDDNFDWCDIHVGQREMDPFLWAGYFKHAEAVMTCTFHGLMFSLIFHRPIIFHPTSFIMDKASSLIDDLGLRKVLVEEQTFAGKVNWPWNYEDIQQKLNVQREKSMKFLQRALCHHE